MKIKPNLKLVTTFPWMLFTYFIEKREGDRKLFMKDENAASQWS